MLTFYPIHLFTKKVIYWYLIILVSSFGDGEDEIAQEEIDLPLTRTNTDKDGDFLAFT